MNNLLRLEQLLFVVCLNSIFFYSKSTNTKPYTITIVYMMTSMKLIDHKLFKFISKVFASYVRRNVSLSTEANTYTHTYLPTHLHYRNSKLSPLCNYIFMLAGFAFVCFLLSNNVISVGSVASTVRNCDL